MVTIQIEDGVGDTVNRKGDMNWDSNAYWVVLINELNTDLFARE